MIHKFLLSFLLTTTLLTSTDSCFAMDPEQDDLQAISKLREKKKKYEKKIKSLREQIKELPQNFPENSLEEQDIRKGLFELNKHILEKKIEDTVYLINYIEPIIMVENIKNIYNFIKQVTKKLEGEGDEAEKEDYCKIILLIENALKDDEYPPYRLELYKMGAICHLTWGLSFCKLCNCFSFESKLFKLQDLKEGTQLIQRGYQYSKNIEVQDQGADLLNLKKTCKETLTTTADVLKAMGDSFPSEDLFARLENYSTTLDLHSQLLNMEGVPDTQNPEHLKFLSVIMDFSGRIYRNTLTLNIKSSTPTFQEINKLKSTAQILADTACFLKQHLIVPQLNWIFVSYDTSKEIISHEFDHSPKWLDAPMLFQLLYKNFCSTHKTISNVFLNLETPHDFLKEGYRKKSNEHLQYATQAYKENLFPPNIKNKKSFIHASLEAYVGNDQPLKEFYANLRKERKKNLEAAIAQEIRAKQAEIKEQKKSKKREEKLRKDKSEQKKPEKKIIIESEVLVSSSSIEPMDDPIPEKEMVKKEKVKTRREADPSRATKKPTKVVPHLEIKIAKPTHFISPKSYYDVFLVLIGESLQRNVTCKQVKKLLKELKCIITKATGGSHGKATDPNTQEMWTIPPEWDKIIPDFYRLQLMEFLLGKMELNPEDVQPRGGS